MLTRTLARIRKSLELFWPSKAERRETQYHEHRIRILAESVAHHSRKFDDLNSGVYAPFELELDEVAIARHELQVAIRLLDLWHQFSADLVGITDVDGPEDSYALSNPDHQRFETAVTAARRQGIPVDDYLEPYAWSFVYR